MKTSIDCLQCGHVIRSVSEGARRISSSQALHLKCIMRTMKPLILLLLLGVSVQAQTIADAARKERARQAHIRSAQVITGKGSERNTATPPSVPATAPRPPAPTATPAVPAKPAVAPVPSPAPALVADPAAKWNAEVNRLRAKVQELQDQERSLQLQVNQLTNQFFAPVSDQSSRDQAQARLGETQNKLTAVRAELDQTKKALDAMQVQGPPKQ